MRTVERSTPALVLIARGKSARVRACAGAYVRPFTPQASSTEKNRHGGKRVDAKSEANSYHNSILKELFKRSP